MKKRLPAIRQRLTDNGSYKLVALFVTLVLWVTILGRKNEVQVRDMNLDFLLSPHQVITNKVAQRVRVKVSGPRMALNKFARSEQAVTLNLTDEKPGLRRVTVDQDDIELPVGVKLISIRPSVIRARIEENQRGESKE